MFKRSGRSLSIAMLWLVCNAGASGQSPSYQRTFPVELKDAVALDIRVSKGDVTVSYNRDGQVSIYAFALDARGKSVSKEFFESTLNIEQTNNRIAIRDNPHDISPDAALKISYKIDVPFRTEVRSVILGAGNQTVLGITGPATLITGIGDIEASYVRSGLVKAETGKGKISCTRVAQVEAETGSGSITLMEDGPSKATVKKGMGRIDVGGARGGFQGSTDRGELHIKAVPWDDWQLNSISGNIRVELPPGAGFEVDIATTSGEIAIGRGDMERSDAVDHRYHQKVNGGGKLIQVRSDTGSVSID